MQTSYSYRKQLTQGTLLDPIPSPSSPTKFDNLKTAKALGIELLLSLLARADEVIE